MRLIGTIRPTETREIEVEADSYAEARAKLGELVPEGWMVIAERTG